MGLLNLRAICPKCGGKINTQAKGLGHFTWMRSGMLVKTGDECQWCGLALSGDVGADNVAIAADDPRAIKKAEKKEVKAQKRQESADQLKDDGELFMAYLIENGPSTIVQIKQDLEWNDWKLARVLASLSSIVKAKGFGPRRVISLRNE